MKWLQRAVVICLAGAVTQVNAGPRDAVGLSRSNLPRSSKRATG